MKLRRWSYWGLGVVNVLVLPVTALSALLWLNSFSPMQIGFVTDFEVRNLTSERLEVTPLGAVFRSPDERFLLPTFFTRFPAIETWPASDLPVDPGESREVLYDWDDIQFTELLITAEDGKQYLMQTGKFPTRDAYYSPGTVSFVIDDLSALRRVDDGLPFQLRVTEARLLPFLAVRFLPWPLHIAGLIALARWYGRRKRVAGTGTPRRD